MSELPNKSDEQKSAQSDVEAFRKNLGPFVSAAETTRMAMVFTNAKAPGNPIIFANDSFLALTGYDRAEVLGKKFNFLMARVTDPAALARIEAELKIGTDNVFQLHCSRKDGSKFWAATFISAVRDESGAVVQHFASLVDLTEHMEELAHSRMLIEELNHRVKNTLSTVQSIVRQALRNSTDPDVIRTSIESRLFALSRSHDLLTSENWQGVGLCDLVNSALQPFRVEDGPAERLAIRGENIRLPPKATLALGIAFHELATNAVKCGALSNTKGSVLLAWTIEKAAAGDRLKIRWQERNGPPVTPPSRKGFGSQVLEQGLAHELEGTIRLEYPAEGCVCTIDIPAPKGTGNG